jgi:hypothetical protein
VLPAHVRLVRPGPAPSDSSGNTITAYQWGVVFGGSGVGKRYRRGRTMTIVGMAVAGRPFCHRRRLCLCATTLLESPKHGWFSRLTRALGGQDESGRMEQCRALPPGASWLGFYVPASSNDLPNSDVSQAFDIRAVRPMREGAPPPASIPKSWLCSPHSSTHLHRSRCESFEQNNHEERRILSPLGRP